MYEFIETSQAKEIIAAQVSKTPTVLLPLAGSLGYYLAEQIIAPISVPSFDNSAMDGYGFRYSDLEHCTHLIVSGEIAAGRIRNTTQKLQPGEAVRILTGAKIPDGVDTVIMQEKVTVTGNTISFEKDLVNHGANIRLTGSQTQQGTAILSEGTLINHAVIGFLAGFGIAYIRVYNKPKLGLLFTGNELVAPGTPLMEGEIYNSNTFLLQAALAELDIPITNKQHIQDNLDATLAAIERALEDSDILLITGGISVGDYDYVKDALEKTGVETLFYKVKQKPGKPLWFGRKGNRFVFALPGNPASVFSCYHQYVKPFIKGCSGRTDFYEEAYTGVLSATIHKKSEVLTQFLKGQYYRGKVVVLEGQESYKMDSVARANCLVEFPSGITEIKKGETVKLWTV